MKVIVTGSEGFIGKALVRRIQSSGIDVIRVDRREKCNRYCVREASEIGKILDKEDISGVFHLAAQTSVFNENIDQIRQDNIDTFIAVADECARRGIKLVYASSSTAHDGNTSSMYGISKRFDEQYARCYCPNATGVRLHNVYGPYPRQGTLLWSLLHDGDITLYNQGKNVRHFTYIDDAVEGLVYAYGCNHPLINVANPQEMSTWVFCQFLDDELRRLRGQRIEVPFEATVHLIPDKRERDHERQDLDPAIPTAPLDYMTVADGLHEVLYKMLTGPEPRPQF